MTTPTPELITASVLLLALAIVAAVVIRERMHSAKLDRRFRQQAAMSQRRLWTD